MLLHQQALVVPLLILPSLAQNVFWIDPSCPDSVARGMNEARFVTNLLDETLDLKHGDVEYLDEPMKWFFNFDTTDLDHVELVQERLHNIAIMTRSFVRTEANIRIFCMNQKQWKPNDPGSQNPDTWSSKDNTMGRTYFKHEVEGIHTHGEELYCRFSDEEALAVTTAYDAQRQIGAEQNSLDNVVIDICDLLLKDLSATSGDAVLYRLSSFQEVSEIKTIAYTLIHELIHVPKIGGGKVDGQEIFAPSDVHVTENNEQKSGYYTNTEEEDGVSRLPGEYLQEPKLTITNPDSYMYFCMYFGFERKGWDMEMDENDKKKLKFVWSPPDPDDNAEDWSMVDGQWRFTGKEWETNQPPNWIDKATPSS